MLQFIILIIKKEHLMEMAFPIFGLEFHYSFCLFLGLILAQSEFFKKKSSGEQCV